METLKEKNRQPVTRMRLPRHNTERYAESSGEFRGIFKELRERLSAIAEADTRPLSAYENAHPEHH